MDTIDRETRSRNMSRIRSRDTVPEVVVRSIAHRLGYRFRKHVTDLPGRPDMVFRSRWKVVFVHGCFWHRHPGCRLAYMPKSNVSFWQQKFQTNVARDARVLNELKEGGWEPLVIWQCESVDHDRVAAMLVAHLGKP